MGLRVRVAGLAEEVEGAGAGDVDLLGVVTGQDEDGGGGGVVGEGRDGGLDRGVLCGRPHEKSASRTSFKGIPAWCLACLAIEGISARCQWRLGNGGRKRDEGHA